MWILFDYWILIFFLLKVGDIIYTLLSSDSWFPLTRRTERCAEVWLKTLFSSWPVCLALVALSFLISVTATLCYPPKVSATIGRNRIASLRQFSDAPAIFVPYLHSRAWPGVAAAPLTLKSWRGLTTVMSRAASSPAAQLWMKSSAGRLTWPGNRKLFSLQGPSTAEAARLWRWSHSWLWQEICSPPWPQQSAWSPYTLLLWRQTGQGPSTLYTWQPSLYLYLVILHRPKLASILHC